HHSRREGTPYPVEECPVYRALESRETCRKLDETLWRKDGKALPVVYTANPIKDAGQVVGAVVTFLDMTERQELEAKLRQSQRLEAVGQLTGGIAHDFNNLLTIIMGNSELLVERLPNDERLRKMAETTRK